MFNQAEVKINVNADRVVPEKCRIGPGSASVRKSSPRDMALFAAPVLP
jgi:hypothetical protein